MGRKYLKVRRGEVDKYIDFARWQGIGEIQEVDNFYPGQREIVEEPDAPVNEERQARLQRLRSFDPDFATARQVARRLEDLLNLLGLRND